MGPTHIGRADGHAQRPYPGLHVLQDLILAPSLLPINSMGNRSHCMACTRQHHPDRLQTVRHTTTALMCMKRAAMHYMRSQMYWYSPFNVALSMLLYYAVTC
jgi:hypothetical protein